MGGQPAQGLPRYSADTVVVDLFGRTGNTGAARHQATRISRLATNRVYNEGEEGRKRKRGCGERADRTRMRSGGERLRDEDMHINRETSTEMSDHTVNEPTSLYRTFLLATPRADYILPVHLSPSPSILHDLRVSHPPANPHATTLRSFSIPVSIPTSGGQTGGGGAEDNSSPLSLINARSRREID